MNRVLRVIRNQFNKKLVGLEVQVANKTALSLPQLAELIKEKLNEWNSVKLTLENELEPGYNLVQFEVETMGLKRAADMEKNDFQKIDQSNFVVVSPHPARLPRRRLLPGPRRHRRDPVGHFRVE